MNKTSYDNDGFVQDAVHQAVTDPLAYQISLAGSDLNNPMVKVIFPAVAAAGAGSFAVAGGAVASLASAVATSALKYDPVSDTYTSVSGGVAPGAFVRALSNVSGTAIGLLDAGAAGLVNALQTQLPFLGKLVIVVTAIAMNAANGDGGRGVGRQGAFRRTLTVRRRMGLEGLHQIIIMIPTSDPSLMQVRSVQSSMN
ncbi:hypothetical protein BH11PSE13_BH11PSE13_31180 [soil metagenome]